MWDFLNNGKSKLTASYGRYYTVIPQDIQTRALGNEYTTFAYNYSQGQRDPIADPNVASYAYVQGGELVQPDLKGMYQDELILGVEYELFKNWSVGVRGVYKALGRVMEDRCDVYDPRLNLAGFVPAGALTTCSLVNLGDSNDPLQKVTDPNNPACVGAPRTGTLSGNCETTNLHRFYRGVELNVAHRFSNNFYMLANYVYSSLRGSFDGNEFQVNGQQDPNISAGFDYVDFAKNSFGRMALDRKNQFKISGTYAFPFGLTAGGDFHYASGAPFVVHGYLRPGYFVEGFLTPGRGEVGSMPAIWEADLHLEYNLRIGSVTITPMADAFNLLNRQGITNVDGTFNQVDLASNDPGPPDREDQPGDRCTAANATYSNRRLLDEPQLHEGDRVAEPDPGSPRSPRLLLIFSDTGIMRGRPSGLPLFLMSMPRRLPAALIAGLLLASRSRDVRAREGRRKAGPPGSAPRRRLGRGRLEAPRSAHAARPPAESLGARRARADLEPRDHQPDDLAAHLDDAGDGTVARRPRRRGLPGARPEDAGAAPDLGLVAEGARPSGTSRARRG